MTAAAHPTLVSTLIAGLLTTVLGAPAGAADPMPSAGPAPVGATDVTRSDSDLRSTDNEVVVVTRGPNGPQVTKLAADSPAAAQRLTRALDAQPGQRAEVNGIMTLARRTPADRRAKPRPLVTATTSPGQWIRAQAADTSTGDGSGAQQWGLAAVQAQSAWPITKAADQLIAVVDTGIDATHPDLAERVAGPQVDLVPDGRGGDPNGHGTQIAGIIAASLDDYGVSGVAPDARVLSVRALDTDGVGDFATVAEGVIRAVDAGATVVNLSLGSPTRSLVVAQAVEYAQAEGVTVVAAGSNHCHATYYPAGSPGVIGVDVAGEPGRTWTWACGSTWVDVVAPGENVLSTTAGGGWGLVTGTSAAAGFVSATAALVRSANPRFGKDRVDATVFATAIDDPLLPGSDPRFGHGLLQAGPAAQTAARARGGLRAPRLTAVAARSRYGDRLRVDIGPDSTTRPYVFQVQTKRPDGSWELLPADHQTQGADQRRSLHLRPGRYRVVAPAQQGWRGTRSDAVTLTAPTLVATLRPNARRTELVLDVDPDRDAGAWVFQVQRRHSGGQWRSIRTLRTRGDTETRTLDLSAGRYRVVVSGAHGFQGTTSRVVRLVG